MTLMHQVEAKSGCNSFMALASLEQAAMDALPEAVYLCAGDGRVVRFNQRAAELWGRIPRAGDPEERFCGSFRMYRTDGTLLPHDQCPMATALQTGESFQNQEVVVEQPDGRRLTVLVNIAPLKDEKGRVKGAINCFQDITDRKQAEERQRQLIEELNHRIKNTLATVQSMATITTCNVATVDEFTSRFEARLLALSQAHKLLSEGEWSGAKLRHLLVQQLGPFADGGDPRVRFEGPEVDLPPRLTLALGMMFHELMTNAAKYGSLSVAGGHTAVEWDLLSGSDGGRRLTLHWVEMDGPSVKVPERRGFGTRLIERTITEELGGQANLLFEPSGLQLRVSIPLRK